MFCKHSLRKPDVIQRLHTLLSTIMNTCTSILLRKLDNVQQDKLQLLIIVRVYVHFYICNVRTYKYAALIIRTSIWTPIFLIIDVWCCEHVDLNMEMTYDLLLRQLEHTHTHTAAIIGTYVRTPILKWTLEQVPPDWEIYNKTNR